jgi:hypothetical protein
LQYDTLDWQGGVDSTIEALLPRLDLLLMHINDNCEVACARAMDVVVPEAAKPRDEPGDAPKAEAPAEEGKSIRSCFPADAWVTVEGRGAVAMSRLGYGDRVLSRDRATGQLAHREVGGLALLPAGGVQCAPECSSS